MISKNQKGYILIEAVKMGMTLKNRDDLNEKKVMEVTCQKMMVFIEKKWI